MATREYRRRHVVRTAGLVAITGAAGCLGDGDGDEVESDEGADTPSDGEPADDEDDEAERDDGEDDDSGMDDAETADEGTTGDDPDADGADDSGEPNDDPADGAETEEPDGEDPDETAESDEGDTDEDGTEATDDSASEDEGEPDDPDGFVTYTNEELGYAISHPETWEIDDGGEEVYIGDPDGGRELGILAFDAADYEDVEALAAGFLAGLEADYEDVEIREEGDRTIESGQDARLLDIAYVNPDDDRGRRRSRMLFVIDPETDAGYVAEVAASAEAFDDAVEAHADAMLESFRLEGIGSVSLGTVGLPIRTGSALPTRP